MATPGLARIWSLHISPAKEAPPAPNFDIWVANYSLFARSTCSNFASQLATIPRSENRLRDGGIIPLYSLVRDLFNAITSSAHEQGVIAPATPAIPPNWSEEASIDYKTLTAQFHPHVAEPVRAGMDWFASLRDGETEPHWSSVVAAYLVSIDLYVQMMPAMGGMLEAMELGPFVALITGGELARIIGVITEEILRIRGQPGSGWNEEEAKRLAKEHLEILGGIIAVGT